MIFLRVGIRQLERMNKVHALLVLGACFAILFFILPRRPMGITGTLWASQKSNQNDAEIDSALQAVANTQLNGREGTIIIMDARTGRVRAVVNPTVAYTQSLMPGSAIKPFTALAALRAGLIDEDSRTTCPGRFTGLGFSLPCVHADHLPPFSPSQAIAYSCNYYFATLGQRLGRDNLTATLREFDFGQATGIAPNEVAGVVRPCEGGNTARLLGEANHVSTQADCGARSAVGESDHVQVTPLQLLTAYAALVNGGHLYQPRVAAANDFQPVERARIDIAEAHRTIITEGMAGAIRFGTARSARLDSLPLTIIGKTGTAMPAKGFRSNGWFIGFAAPFESNRKTEPSQIDLAVLVLLSRAHGSEAAAVAKPIFEAYASEVARRDSGTERAVTVEVQNEKTVVTSSRSSLAASTVRVHLVHDNVTEELSLEDYVLGVMRAEGTMESEPEALKALAIAVRTYALKNIGRHAKDGFDFCSTTHCQRFVVGGPRDGKESSSDAIIQAVRATAGQVLLDERGQLVESYFGASCGGETANIGELWGVTPAEYLRGVRDEYCLSGPHAKWTDTISRADLLRALKSDPRTEVGDRLDRVIVSKRDETGRAEIITLEGERQKQVRGWDFKIIVGRVLGWNVLKSSRFEVSHSGSNFIFRGSGFGHGLGLCQEGAHVMAARGVAYQRILEKYFPGTRVSNDAETRRRGDTASQNESVPWKGDVLLENNFSTSPRPRVSTSGRFVSIASEHFRVTYPADVDRRDADQVLSTLESARNDYQQRAATAGLSINLPTLEIRLNESTGDFTSRTGQPWWAAAATKGNRIEFQPLGLLKRRGVLSSTLRHELAHVIIDAVSHNRAPRWLAEGFALYLAGEGRTISQYATLGVKSTEDLEKRMEHPRTQQEMRQLYAQAYLTVSEQVRKQGEASVWKNLAGS